MKGRGARARARLRTAKEKERKKKGNMCLIVRPRGNERGQEEVHRSLCASSITEVRRREDSERSAAGLF